MKHAITIGAVLMAMIVICPPVSGAEENPWLVGIYANYGSFDASGVDADGTQALTYAQIIYDKQKWGAGLTTAYTQTSYMTDGADDRYEISGLTDTTLTTYYKIRKRRTSLRLGLDINLPTGKSSNTISDLGRELTDDVREDLLQINSYGGGLNLVPHVSLSHRRGNVTWGLGARFMSTGEYDPTTDVDDDNFDPGDSYTLVGSSLVSLGGKGSLMLTLMYTATGSDKQGDRQVFQEGDLYTLEARYVRSWKRGFTSSLVGVIRKQDKNKLLDGSSGLSAETGNSNGNVVDIFLESAYVRDRKLTITGIAGYGTAVANGYSSGDDLYDAGRTRIYIEPGSIWRYSKSAYATFKLRLSRIEDKADAFSTADATYTVINIDAGVVYSF